VRWIARRPGWLATSWRFVSCRDTNASATPRV